MRLTIAAAALMGLTALTPAFAAEVECKQPEASWKPVEELKTKLTAEGWTIKNVKIEDGCYEVYGKDEKGQRVEIFFDPVSFEAVGSDD